QFKPYYIGENRMIVLMMKMETDIMVMTTPDLENFQLKRSYVKKDIEYIYIPHDVNSANLSFHKEALDHYDTIFTSGPKNRQELAEREQKYGLPAKNLVEWGSSVIDNMTKSYEEMIKGSVPEEQETRTVLIAPSWQKDNILDSCIEEMLDRLAQTPYRVIVRPHPQYVRHFEARIDALAAKYKDILFQKDFSSNKTVYTADLLVTDWSSIAFEYAFATLKPVLFVDTPMKILNPDYRELETVPIDIELRHRIGISITPEAVGGELKPAVDKLLWDVQFSKESMRRLKQEYIYNNGESGKVGAKYIIDRLVERSGK
ncbi:MAG: CDP-glycerol glycerophosphotransferase family protein, partial [Lachnospiraceae bacterium]|nr:CDP-glycerol glycerophosphotransferase family protein [Lachnospiraceae bacterium]